MGKCKNICSFFGVALLAALPAILPRLSQSLPLPYLTNFKFSLDQIPDMTGKIVIVTGGNSGLGYVSARELARKGAKVVIGCRSEAKAQQAILDMRRETGNPELDVTTIPLVLDDLSSVDNFANLFSSKYDRIDVLMNNAGKFFPTFALTKQGIEGNMGVHHVAHTLLFHRLLPLLEAGSSDGVPSRVVQVSSHAHQQCEGIDFVNLNDQSKYSSMHRYCESKLANILFAREAAKRLLKQKKPIIVNSNHPGLVITDFSLFQKLPLVDKIAYDMQGGALTQLHLASSHEFADYHITGQYYYPVGVQARWGIETTASAHDPVLQDKLWRWTTERIREYDASFESI